MSVDEKHPDWLDRVDEWSMLRDAERGHTRVLSEGTKYLSIPDGFKSSATLVAERYNNYKDRAQFPDFLEPTITGMVGLVHHKEPTIKMPTSLNFIFENATVDKMPLEVFHRRVTREILLTGRFGIHAEAPIGGGDPYLSGYSAEAITNWRKDRTLFVLDECGKMPNPDDEFGTIDQKLWRVLRLVDGKYTVQLYKGDSQSAEPVEDIKALGDGFKAIPFVVVGPRDLDVRPDNPPLLGVARAAFAAYRLDADYRHQLFWTGQETAVFTGVPEGFDPSYLGSSVFIKLTDPQAKMAYVGPSGKGIEMHRTAIQDERERAVLLGAQLMEGSKRSVESGEALSIRMASKNASLKTVALASASALERSLRNIAIFKGVNPEEVTVKASLEFVDATLDPADAEHLMNMWIGESISYQTYYENLQRGGIASEERNAEEERVLIDKETLLDPPPAPPAKSGAPTPKPKPKNVDPNNMDPTLA